MDEMIGDEVERGAYTYRDRGMTRTNNSKETSEFSETEGLEGALFASQHRINLIPEILGRSMGGGRRRELGKQREIRFGFVGWHRGQERW